MAQGNGTGTTLSFQSFDADILSVGFSGMTRPSVDRSHLGTTTAMTFAPGDLYDAGSININYALDLVNSATKIPTINGDSTTWTVTFPGGSTMTGSGFCTDAELGNFAINERV